MKHTMKSVKDKSKQLPGGASVADTAVQYAVENATPTHAKLAPKNDGLTTYEDIELTFANSNLPDVEAFAEMYKNDSAVNYRLHVLCLKYIQNRELWRHDKRYEKASFADYARDKWNLAPATLDAVYSVFKGYPKEALELGPGPIVQAVKTCAPTKVPAAVKEMIAEHRKTNTGLTPAKKVEILSRHKRHIPPPTPKTPTIESARYWQNRWMECDKERQAILLENKSLKIQIAKLKASVRRAEADAQEYKEALDKWAEPSKGENR
jgi:hypothetical protein